MKMRLILILASVPVVVLLAATACSPAEGPEGSNENAVTVAAAFYPLFEAAERVGGNRVETTNVTPPGAEPHDIELSPDQVDEILDADVVLYLGGGFQAAVDQVVEGRDGITVNVLAEVVPEGTSDPHIWLDPVLMARIGDVVAEALSEADPEGSDAYEANAAAYRAEIADLNDEFEQGLTGCEHDTFITTHAAFGHLARRYGLVERAIAGLEPESEPDPKKLAELEDLFRREGVTTVFTEPLVSPEVAETLARETGARVAVLDPVEGLAPERLEAGDSYVTVMERNLDALQDALGCQGGA
jgi:zinc transport system substrate-binding protein